MNQIILPEDVDNVIQSFILVNNGDEATENLILAIGAELLDISADTMAERIDFTVEENEADEWVFDYKSAVYGYPYRCPKCGSLSGDSYDQCEDCVAKLTW